MILVDTSVWIDFFRNTCSWEAQRLADAIESDDSIAVCGPILMEIRQGIAADGEIRRVDRFLSPLVYLPTFRKTYGRAADIYRAARAKGKTIRNSIDCLIAACALEAHAQLLQRDKDFLVIAEVSKLKLLRSE